MEPPTGVGYVDGDAGSPGEEEPTGGEGKPDKEKEASGEAGLSSSYLPPCSDCFRIKFFLLYFQILPNILPPQ